MLDIKFIREHPEVIRDALQQRGVSFDLDSFLTLDDKRCSQIRIVERLRELHNKESHAIGSGIRGAAAQSDAILRLREQKVKLADAEFELRALETEFTERLEELPNIPLPDVPVGPDASANVVIREWGTPTIFSFASQDHLALGEALDVIDVERASRVSGSRFGYFKREAALIEFALVHYALQILTSGDALHAIADTVRPGYPDTPCIPVIPPAMIRPDVFRKMARLSRTDKDERYHLPQDDLYLVGSAEHTLGPLHMEETLDADSLPLRYVGFSTSFRREAGSYGKDTRGVLRVHQFDKLELESFTAPEDSLLEQEFFVAIQERLVQGLGIPYRVVMIATGDMGRPDARQVDIECWLPGQGQYRETHTADLMTDYQARRLGTKIRRQDGTTAFAHMNDATAFAIGRTIIAILENYQREDGSVEIPEALRPWMHGLAEIRPRQ